MRITRGKITITDVAGVDYIEVDTQNSVAVIKFGYAEHPISYECAKLIDLRDALTAAIDAMTEANNAAVAESINGRYQSMVKKPQPKPVAEVGDIFNRGDEEPANILTLRDCEGDTWRKYGEGDYRYGGASIAWMWETLLDSYGPLTVTAVGEQE